MRLQAGCELIVSRYVRITSDHDKAVQRWEQINESTGLAASGMTVDHRGPERR
jgi:hypothetical protein